MNTLALPGRAIALRPYPLIAVGSLSGLFLAFRMGSGRNLISFIGLAAIWTVALTLLNLIVMGAIVAGRFEESHWSYWTYQWPKLLISIGQVTFFSVLFSALLAAAGYWTRRLYVRGINREK